MKTPNCYRMHGTIDVLIKKQADRWIKHRCPDTISNFTLAVSAKGTGKAESHSENADMVFDVAISP